MAYKFQLGAFVASGSIKAEDGVNANSAGVGAAGAIAGATTIAASGLASVGSVVPPDKLNVTVGILTYPLPLFVTVTEPTPPVEVAAAFLEAVPNVR